MEKLNAEALRSVLNYDPVTGIFIWNRSRAENARSGQIAGTMNGQGYLRILVFKRQYQAHRLAWLHHYGKWPDGVIDHIDGNKANNAIANLRDCSRTQNQQNMRMQKHNRSGFKGVSRSSSKKNPWKATIGIAGKCKHLGNFPTAEAAHEAYVAAAHTHFGGYARSK